MGFPIWNVLRLILLCLFLPVMVEGGVETYQWNIHMEVGRVEEPTLVHVRMECRVSPTPLGADSSRFTLRGLGEIFNLRAYDALTREPLRVEYLHPQGIVYFGETKKAHYTFTIECDVRGNLIPTPSGYRFHWDTSNWPKNSQARIWFSLPQGTTLGLIEGVEDYDLIVDGVKRVVHFEGDAQDFSWALHMKVDRIGPQVKGLNLVPNPTDGAVVVTLSARVDDGETGGSRIERAEYFIGEDPGIGRGVALSAVDGKFDSPIEDVRREIDVGIMDVGDYVIYLRAMDEAGNWGKASSSILSCREPHPLLPMVYVVYFDTAKVKIKEEGKRVLDEVARLAKKYPDLSIRVEGHTDSRPINTKEFPSNYELSIGRARAVAAYLKETHGINGSISIFGYGPKRPIAPNSTQEGMAKNRRAEIIFIKEE